MYAGFTALLAVELGAMLGLWRTITSRHAEHPVIGAGVLTVMTVHFWRARRELVRQLSPLGQEPFTVPRGLLQ